MPPDWEESILDSDGLPLARWLREGRARVVKDGEHRTVYRVDLPGGTIYVKHYRCQSLPRAGRSLIRASAARREFRKMREVARRKVPTARAIGFGELRRHGLVLDNYFVTEALPDAVPLDECLNRDLPLRPATERAVLRRRLACAMAEFCAALHAAGVVQDDLHPGNILVEWAEHSLASAIPAPHAAPSVRATSTSDRFLWPRLYLIDLPGVRLLRPLSWRATRDNLVMLHASLATVTTRSDRWRFWRTYQAARRDLRIADPRQAAHEIARGAREFACRNWRGRDARSLRNNRDFQAFRHGHTQVHAVAALDRKLLEFLADEPASLLHKFQQQPMKLGHSSVVVRAELPLAGEVVEVAYKRCRTPAGWKRLLAPFRKPRAWRGWYLGQALYQRGIPTAQPLCLIHPPGGDSYLATAWIPGAENLHLFAWRLAQQNDRAAEIRARQTAASLGCLLGRLHRWQIAHRDLKWGNLLAAERAETVETAIIDLDGVRIRSKLKTKERVRNLARFAASLVLHPAVRRSHCQRFLLAYLREYGEGEDWKVWWRQIAAACQQLIRRKHRRGWQQG